MLFTTAQQRRERLDICMQCPIYVANTYSCGTFGHLFQDKVTLDGVTFKPCGCNLRAKASLKHADCPAGKWPVIISKKDLAVMEDIAKRVTKQRFIVKEDRDRLNEIFSSYDPTFRLFNCSSCGGEIFNVLNQLLTDIQSGVVEVQDNPPSHPPLNPSDVPARIKRNRKKNG